MSLMFYLEDIIEHLIPTRLLLSNDLFCASFTAETAFASSRANFSAAVGLYIGDLECISTLLMWKLYSDLSHKGNFLETTLLYACMECMERIQIHGSSYCECT